MDDEINLAGALEVSSGAELIPVKRVIASTIDVIDNSVVAQFPTTATQFFKVDLNTAGLTVDATSRIDATGRGFLGGGKPGNPFVVGPGGSGMTAGFQLGSTGRSGGSYGGLGGSSAGSANPVYGVDTDPNEPGSGGASAAGTAGSGGGLVRIAAQTFTLNGQIKADGETTTSYGAGSGGGIRIDVGTLTGSGQITANGGSGRPDNGGGGGGGRVAIYYQSLDGFTIASQVTVSGGAGNGAPTPGPNGADGTVFELQVIAMLLPMDDESPIRKAEIESDEPIRFASLDNSLSEIDGVSDFDSYSLFAISHLPNSNDQLPLTIDPASRLRNLKQLIAKVQSTIPTVSQRRLYRPVSSTNDQTDQIDQTNNRHQNRALALLTPDASRLTDVDPIYTYDLNGNRASMIDPTGLTTYTYDELNRLMSITNNQGLTTAFTYDALGRRTSMTHDNGVMTNYTYDAASQLLSLVHRLGLNPPINSFTYSYDKVGNRTAKADNNGTANYTYDTLNRLVQATNPIPSNPLESFTYDEVGNRVDSNQNGLSMFNDANQLEEDASFNYLYDNNGNLTQKTNKITSAFTLYEYDAENKLIRVVRDDGSIVNYKYDGLGRRIEKEVDSVVTQFIYDQEDILLELDGSNNITARYTHGPDIDEPLIVERSGVSSFYHTDGLGSITELTDTIGTIIQSYTYSSFGKIESQLDPNFVQPYTFTAREFDPETGLYYYRARSYDPLIGRFLQQDPILSKSNPQVPYLMPFLLSAPLMLNQYTYVGDNPVISTDSLGLINPRSFVVKWAFRVGLSFITGIPFTLGAGVDLLFPNPLNSGQDEALREALRIERETQALQQSLDEIRKDLQEARERFDKLCAAGVLKCGRLLGGPVDKIIPQCG